jgi:hypothetical protein
MPRSIVVLPPTPVETSAGLLAMGQRARRFARMLDPGDEAATRLLEFAIELEARAAQLDVAEVKRPTDSGRHDPSDRTPSG